MYENNTLGRDISVTGYQPSSEYSLFKETKSGGRANDTDEYNVLDRSNGRDRTKNREIHKGEEIEGYSKLSYQQ